MSEENSKASLDPLVTVHTHDRISYRRCRRKWSLSSPLRAHLEPIDKSGFSALWFGSGFHFALEDYHSYNRFGHPADAYIAYQEAFKVEDRPANWEELENLAVCLFSYYLSGWLPKRKTFETLWLNGEPMVEVQFRILLPEVSKHVGYDVYYEGTFDRIVIDENGDIWILDYKTAAQFDTNKLETDPQVNAYCWAGEKVIGLPVAGMIYMQFLKAVPSHPKILKSGLPSLDVRQRTPHYLYRQCLMEIFGEPSNFPKEYIAFLNELAEQETPEGDKFIRFDRVYRNEAFKRAEESKIYYEAVEMLNPDLPIYPNPTRDCKWDCSFRSVCLAMDDGSDPDFLLSSQFQVRKEDTQEWRKRIKYPERKES